MHRVGVRTFWEQPPSPIYRENGEEVAAQLAQASRWLPREALRKSIGLDLLFFFVLGLTNLKWKSLTQGYRNFTKALRKPRRPIFKKRERAAAQLAPAS